MNPTRSVARRSTPRQAPAKQLRAGQRLRATQLVEDITAHLAAFGRPERAVGEKAYLESELEFYGIDTPTMRRETRRWLEHNSALDHRGFVALIRQLWRPPIHELKAFAMELLFLRQKELTAGDIDLLEWILRRSGTWAYIDAIAVRVAGPLVERHPELAVELDRWSLDADFWIRRSAMLTLLIPLRRGDGDWERFVGYAEAMLEEREFFIRKAIGWILREVGKKRPGLVSEFLAPRLERVSGLTLREGIKYLPTGERQRLPSSYLEHKSRAPAPRPARRIAR